VQIKITFTITIISPAHTCVITSLGKAEKRKSGTGKLRHAFGLQCLAC